jgi:hypothetical protein
VDINITCPGPGDDVKVTAGEICVQGKITESIPDNSGLQVLARVVGGYVGAGSAGPPTPQPGDGLANPVGQFWCARGVAVPPAGSGGWPLTAFAWLLDGSSGSGSTQLPATQQFQGGGSVDCCPSSGCGAPDAPFAVELVSGADLLVTVSSGMQAGEHRAVAVAFREWRLTIGGETYRVVCREEVGLVLHGPFGSAPSSTFESDPFSATFPGHLLGADEEIVVIVA